MTVLTKRQAEIVGLIKEGVTKNKEIAKTLCIEPSTVKAHLQNIKKRTSSETKRFTKINIIKF